MVTNVAHWNNTDLLLLGFCRPEAIVPFPGLKSGWQQGWVLSGAPGKNPSPCLWLLVSIVFLHSLLVAPPSSFRAHRLHPCFCRYTFSDSESPSCKDLLNTCVVLLGPCRQSPSHLKFLHFITPAKSLLPWKVKMHKFWGRGHGRIWGGGVHYSADSRLWLAI